MLAVLVPALLAAGCTAGPSTRPAVVQLHDAPTPPAPTSSPRKVPLPQLEKPQQQAINWRDCDEQTRRRLGERGVGDDLHFSCAGVITRTHAPGGAAGVKRIHILKVGSGEIPLAVLNDIGGTPGTLYAARLAARLPEPLLQKFSLIGIDRRGSGLSDPINCIPDDVRVRMLSHDPAEGSVAPLLDAARSAGQKCAIALEGERAAYDSLRAAVDLEQIRKALGVSHLNAIARGEASGVLIAYAARYPGHVGRFVLNGVEDPAPNPATVFTTKAKATKAALQKFAARCGGDCPLGADPRAAVADLIKQLRREPAPTGAGYSLGPGMALRAIRAGLGQPQRWPELADAIAAAASGDAGKLAAFIDPVLRGKPRHPPRLGVMVTTTCNDSTMRPPTLRINKLLAELEQKFPLFGGLAAQHLAWCSPWPPQEEPVRLSRITGVPPILVTSSATDPVTPERGTARAASLLPTAVHVAWQGTGHGALRSGCVLDAVRGFLAEGEVPSQRILCPA